MGEARVRNEYRAEFNSDPSKFQVLTQGAWARVGVVGKSRGRGGTRRVLGQTDVCDEGGVGKVGD